MDAIRQVVDNKQFEGGGAGAEGQLHRRQAPKIVVGADASEMTEKCDRPNVSNLDTPGSLDMR